jgi:thioredoxin-related protein
MVAVTVASLAASIPLARDLTLAGHQAERACIPLLLEFAADDCDYCNLLEEEVLNPTLLNRDYEQRVLMRKLVLDRDIKLHDFTGKPVHASDLASQYKVLVTPTLLFVDHQGRELAERMVGVTTLEFYGGYLDQALDSSKIKLQELGRCSGTNRQRTPVIPSRPRPF